MILAALGDTDQDAAGLRRKDLREIGLVEDPPGPGEFRNPTDDFYVLAASDVADAARLAAESAGRR